MNIDEQFKKRTIGVVLFVVHIKILRYIIFIRLQRIRMKDLILILEYVCAKYIIVLVALLVSTVYMEDLVIRQSSLSNM